MTRAWQAAVVATAFAGCSSLVADPCARGFTLAGGACTAASDGADAGQPGGADAADGRGNDAGTPPGDAPGMIAVSADGSACAADVLTDPDNCGACGIVCASGVCADGACTGSIAGHVIAIGHDYREFDDAMAQVLANAVGLGLSADVGVAIWSGTASSLAVAGAADALASGMKRDGRRWHSVAVSSPPSADQLAAADVVVIEAQTGSGDVEQATGSAWQPTLGAFVSAGGVVVVLEGANGTSYQFAAGAGLFDVGAPTIATGDLATVVAPGDATTTNVVSPYLAEPTSVAFPTTTGATITSEAGTIVFDLAGTP